MTAVSVRLRQSVVMRAANRCEYCCLSQEGQEATFHIDPLRMNRPLVLAIRREERARGLQPPL